jgi:hypothetical protein
VVTVSLLVGLLVALVVVGLVVLLSRRDRQSTPEPLDYQTLVELHRIRRRFDVAQLKSELRRNAADARRALRTELDKLDGEP